MGTISINSLDGIYKTIANLCDSKIHGGNGSTEIDAGREKGLYKSAVDSISGDTFIFQGKKYNADGSSFNSEWIQNSPYSFKPKLVAFDFNLPAISPDKEVETQQNMTIGKVSGYSNEFDDKIIYYARKYGVEPNIIKAIIRQESNFNPNAKSSTNDHGLMQLNARYFGVQYDIDKNLDTGCKLYAEHLRTFGGDKNKALMAYNMGAGGARKQLKAGNQSTNYSRSVMQHYNELNNSSQFGIVA